jgi:hypothetical protein
LASAGCLRRVGGAEGLRDVIDADEDTSE